MIWTGVLGIAVMVTCEGFFAGAETAIISCNRVKISHLAEKGRWRARMVRRMLDSPERLLATTLLGVNVSVVIGSILTNRVVEGFSGHWSFLVSTAIMWPLAVLVGEILPKIIFYTYADKAVLLAVLPLRLISALLFPVVYVFTNVGRFVAGIVGAKERRNDAALSREELRILVTEGSDLPTVIPEMREMIERIFDFKSRTADRVMVPIDKVSLAPIDSTVRDIRRLVEESGHSRIPLMDPATKEIPGYIRAVDLVGLEDGEPVAPLAREPLLIRPPDPIDHLLPQFQTAGRHLALVRERNGKVVGILTLEDVLEEIVGEIEDEFD